MRNTISEQDFPISKIDGNCIVSVPIRLSLLESIAFRLFCDRLIDLIEENKAIILDLSQTKFIDSSAIGALVTIHKKAVLHRIQLVLKQPQSTVINVLEISGLTDLVTIQTVARSCAGKPTKLTTHPSVNNKTKRLIDLLGALVGLIIIGIIFIPIAIAIKLDSPGPVLFCQVRCGWMGGKFRMWKFRSMCINAEAMKSEVPNAAQGAFFKSDFDPRITRVGKFLRRTSLDELPQFWNVFKGDMSLVGTRPPTPEEADRYHIPAWQRLNVKPGMTGEWQVNGRSQIRDFEDVIQLDMSYQSNWNLLYDLKLIIKTVKIIFQKNNGAM